eukprot:m.5172 g.5172  ORF g.5172 m.5172 type:complete len:143 (+) comp4850_c0_seq1:82-510(+)
MQAVRCARLFVRRVAQRSVEAHVGHAYCASRMLGLSTSLKSPVDARPSLSFVEDNVSKLQQLAKSAITVQDADNILKYQHMCTAMIESLDDLRNSCEDDDESDRLKVAMHTTQDTLKDLIVANRARISIGVFESSETKPKKS